MKKIILSFAVLLCTLAVYAQKVPKEGDMFVDFTVKQDPKDRASKVSLSDYVGKGKFVLVDFWASWCGPCRAEIPYIRECYEKLPKDKVTILSIAVSDKIEDSKKAAEEMRIEWEQIINAKQIPLPLYGIKSIPHIIIFDPDGKIYARGYRGGDNLLLLQRGIALYDWKEESDSN